MKHSIASGISHSVSHKINIPFPKNCLKSIPYQIFFSQGQTDIQAGNSGYGLY